MPCIPIPKPALPAVPAGLSLSASLPPVVIPAVESPCCILPSLPSLTIPLALPPLVANAAFIAALRAGLEAVEAWYDALPLDCPRA